MASEVALNNVTNLPVAAHQGARTVSSWRGIRPTSMDEAWRMAKVLALAPNMLPKTYIEVDRRPREYDEIVAMVFSAIQMGAEVGLSPMASVQNIAVINGKPGLYGPAMLAVVEASGLLQMIEEAIAGTMADKNMEAVCTVQRYGRQPRTFTFSYEDAKLANLIGKRGPWTEYPKRMFLARARTFALRDVFPDVLAGLSQSVEELIDIPAEDYREIKIQIPAGESMNDLLEQPEPEAPITPEYIVEFEKSTSDQLSEVKTLDALDDLWRSGINAEVRKIGEIDKAAQKRLIAAFSAKKNAILQASQPDQEGVDQSDAIPAAEAEEQAADDARVSRLDKALAKDNGKGQEATQKPAQADPAPAAAKPRDQIDNALDALRKGDDEQASGIPAPAAIKVMKNEDGSPNWSGFFNAAKAQIIKATDDEYGDAWLVAWLKANDEGMAGLRQANPKAADKITGMYTQSLDYQKSQREEAEAEALTEFPTIEVTYNGDSPDWPAFLRNLHGYLGDTPNHRVARAWWTRHSFQVGIIAKTDEVEPGVSGKAAAAEFKAALFARFPELAD